MSDKYKFDDPDGMYFMTTTVVGWVDLLTRPELKHIIINSLRFCQQNKGLIIHAWCLMPSHLHMIASTIDKPLGSIMRDFKKFTSRAIIKEIQGPYGIGCWTCSEKSLRVLKELVIIKYGRMETTRSGCIVISSRRKN
jgi:REP element-mobilizing transposase RayT